MNEVSSRSHAILKLIVEKSIVNTADCFDLNQSLASTSCTLIVALLAGPTISPSLFSSG